MRVGTGGFLALAALLVLAGCAGMETKTAPIAGAENIVVDAPTYKVGDEWRYTGGVFSQVIGFEGDLHITASNRDRFCQGCRYLLDRNGTVVKTLDAQGNPTQSATQGLKFLDFPLRVGKTWSQDIDLRQTSTGAMRPYSNTWKVEAYEEITVKAGTFKAFRIGWHQENRGPYGWSGDATFWWSPDVKAAVKSIAHTSDWFRPWELESYTLK